MLLWCRVISTALSGIKDACAELTRLYNKSIKAKQHLGKAAVARIYFLIQREVIQHGSMQAILPPKAKESSTLPGTPIGIAGKEAAKPTKDSVTDTAEATQALGLLKARLLGQGARVTDHRAELTRPWDITFFL